MRAIERSGMWVSVPVILLAILGLMFLPGCPINPADDDTTDGDDDAPIPLYPGAIEK